ncbi:MAG: hypothetical protein IKU29_00485 [Parabacteroides sp.]|nr:hypothetical protein [Parabacteroides sp.]
MSNDVMKDLKLNRAERRRLAKQAEKETGKKKEELSLEDVMKTLSSNRKKNNKHGRRK